MINDVSDMYIYIMINDILEYTVFGMNNGLQSLQEYLRKSLFLMVSSAKWWIIQW